MAKYYRFPLALLAQKPTDPNATINSIFQWCTVDVGESNFGHMTEADLMDDAKEADLKEYRSAAPQGKRELCTFLGAHMLAITSFSCRRLVSSHADSERFLQMQDTGSVRNRVNMSNDWLWSAVHTIRDNPGERSLSWREFRVLAALLSKIGNSKYAKCGWQEIQARAAGWCGKAAMRATTKAELKRRAPLILTRDMIRTTLARLESDNFFSRFQYNRAESWFSFSCDGDRKKLVDWISNTKARRVETLNLQRSEDTESSAKVKFRKGHHNPSALGKSPPHPQVIPTINGKSENIPTINETPKEPISSPGDPHLVPQVIPTSSPPLTKSNINESNINERATVIAPPPAPLVEHGYIVNGQFLTQDQINKYLRENIDQVDIIRRGAIATTRVDAWCRSQRNDPSPTSNRAGVSASTSEAGERGGIACHHLDSATRNTELP